MLFKTILFAIILVLLCLIALGIGLIITGKPKLRKGCGSQPESKKNCEKNRCEVCKGDHKKRPPF